jgi:CRP-like cAMP-binding protein
MNPYVDQLAQIQLFVGLKREALELIAKVATEESYARGEKIFRHGEVGDKLYLILDGKVRISREVPGMGEEALGRSRYSLMIIFMRSSHCSHASWEMLS